MFDIPLSLKFDNRYICALLDICIEVLCCNYICSKLQCNRINETTIVVVCVVISIVKLFIASSRIKMRIGLGIIYDKTPFELANNYAKTDIRINKKFTYKDNYDFYKKYYAKVKDNYNVQVKNAEFCIFRDLAYLFFVNFVFALVLTLKYNFFYILIFTFFVIYIFFVAITKNKAREFVLQIMIENYRRQKWQ